MNLKLSHSDYIMIQTVDQLEELVIQNPDHSPNLHAITSVLAVIKPRVSDL